jgi:hypothetical protein
MGRTPAPVGVPHAALYASLELRRAPLCVRESTIRVNRRPGWVAVQDGLQRYGLPPENIQRVIHRAETDLDGIHSLGVQKADQLDKLSLPQRTIQPPSGNHVVNVVCSLLATAITFKCTRFSIIACVSTQHEICNCITACSTDTT